jgi:thioredoxin reductase
MYDVIIIGGGPAGLSAALILGRSRRRVVVIDSGRQRNIRSQQMNGFLSRDGIPPAEFLAAARSDVARYGVRIIDGMVRQAEPWREGMFRVRYARFPADGGTRGVTPSGVSRIITSRKLLLATGIRDTLPEIAGVDEFYGTSVHHCPYCDGWEHRDKHLVAYGKGDAAIGLALALRTWSRRVTACTDGKATSSDCRLRAAARGVTVCRRRVARLEGDEGKLQRIVLADGTALRCDALFFNTDQAQRSEIPRRLGCKFKKDGGVCTDDRQCTGVTGVYLAGDADKDVQFVIVAAAEGARAAVSINRDLQDELVKRRCLIYEASSQKQAR